MGELGERLQVAREAKELTVEQVAEATKIPLNYLYALEEETFEVFTSDLHARGFLPRFWVWTQKRRWTFSTMHVALLAAKRVLPIPARLNRRARAAPC
jgi:transcriptional regulator with XRE-family HTH domain